jgi:hypothetical protein
MGEEDINDGRAAARSQRWPFRWAGQREGTGKKRLFVGKKQRAARSASPLRSWKEVTSLLHSRILMLNRCLERFFPLIFPQPASLWGKGIERSVTKVGQERTDLGLRMVKGRVVCGRRPAGGKLSFPPILFSFHYHLLCPRSNPAALGPCYLWLEA